MQERKAGYLKSLKIIHLALLAGQCMFLAVMVLLVVRNILPPVSPSMDKTFQVIVLLLSFGCVFGSINMYKKRLLAINATAESTAEKLAQYRTLNIFQWAMIEGATLFSLVCFFLTGNFSFAALATGLIVFFVMLMPAKIKIMMQLQLSEQEAGVLE